MTNGVWGGITTEMKIRMNIIGISRNGFTKVGTLQSNLTEASGRTSHRAIKIS